MIQINSTIHTVTFNTPFATNHGAQHDQKTMIVSLSDGHVAGYGECTESRIYSVTIAQHEECIRKIQPLIENLKTIPYPPDVWPHLLEVVDGNYFFLCALDQALWDVWARKRGTFLRDHWQESQKLCSSSYTLSSGGIDTVLQDLANHPDWPIYKIKLTQSTDVFHVVSMIRSQTNAELMVDANCAWTRENCLANIHSIEPLGVVAIEQPLSPSEMNEMKVIKNRSPIPLLADESCLVEEDVSRCQESFHGINIKLQKCGGLTPALRMLAVAKEAGMLAMIGCMGGETSIGISHAAQLLSQVDFADIDGAILLSDDPATGAVIENGYCRYSDLAGSGARLF